MSSCSDIRFPLAKRAGLRVNAAAMSILAKIFTWWDGATVGTLLNSWKNGEQVGEDGLGNRYRSEEHTSELQSLMRISYAVFCLKTKKSHRTFFIPQLHNIYTILT